MSTALENLGFPAQLGGMTTDDDFSFFVLGYTCLESMSCVKSNAENRRLSDDPRTTPGRSPDDPRNTFGRPGDDFSGNTP